MVNPVGIKIQTSWYCDSKLFGAPLFIQMVILLDTI
jgi:hypothetical protein